MLKPGWADQIDPAMLGLDESDQKRKVRGKKPFVEFRPVGSSRAKESAARGGTRGTATRVQRAALRKALPPFGAKEEE